MKLSKRFVDRARVALRRYQKILADARGRDVNESDTAVIISDFLADVLGWETYSEITTEFAVRSTFSDLVLKVDGRVAFLIEVKSIGTDLRDNHLRQAVDYAADSGIEWVLLTNGVVWQAHRLRFEQPIRADEVFCIDLIEAAKPAQLLEKLYLISRESVGAHAIDKYWQHKEATSRYVIAQLLLDPATLGVLRRGLRRQFSGLKVSEAEIANHLRDQVLKREVLEGECAAAAERLARRGTRKRAKKEETPTTLTLPIEAEVLV